MVFNNFQELENYLLSKQIQAVDVVKEKVYEVIQGFVRKYYDEYEPEYYVRTYQFIQNLVVTETYVSNGTVYAYVYFDYKKLNYYYNTLKYGSKITVKHIPDNPEKDILYTITHGQHGNWGSKGIHIWKETIEFLHNKGMKLLKAELKKAGIPVRKKRIK